MCMNKFNQCFDKYGRTQIISIPSRIRLNKSFFYETTLFSFIFIVGGLLYGCKPLVISRSGETVSSVDSVSGVWNTAFIADGDTMCKCSVGNIFARTGENLTIMVTDSGKASNLITLFTINAEVPIRVEETPYHGIYLIEHTGKYIISFTTSFDYGTASHSGKAEITIDVKGITNKC